MFTIFHLLQLIGVVGGVVFGGMSGSRFGVAGCIVGAVVGLGVGWVVGLVPWWLGWAWMRYDLRRASSDGLRRRVDEQCCIAHLLIAELASRGEPIDDLRPVIQQQLNSESSDKRRFAHNTAMLWFPDLVGAGEVAAADDGGRPR